MSDKRISKHSLFRLKITVGCPLCTYPSIHFSLDEDTLKITVGCLTSAYPSIHVETLRITVGCPLCTYPSIHILTTLKLSRDHGRLPAVHISKHSQQKLAHVRAVGKNSNRTTTRSSPHARRPSIVDTSKTKAQIWAKGPPDKKKGPFHYRNISCEEFIFYYSFK